jgi:16S rRNA (cytosine967-C5)-methyltransferase
MPGATAREIALQVLLRRAEGGFVEDLLDAALAGSKLSIPDRRLCQELAYGTVRRQNTLDWLIGRKTDARPQKPILQNLLRLGLYQIFWLERIPPHAAVNESVALARQHGFGPQSGFINAILRSYTREIVATRALLEGLKTSSPHLGYSHPEWLVRRWTERWGATETARLLEWNNTTPQTFARVNNLKTDAARLLETWRTEGVEYDFCQLPGVPENLVFRLKSHPPLHKLGSFDTGLFYVQDPSTLAAALEMGIQPGERVLDLCAAPGGKLTFLAQLSSNQSHLVAHDISPERLRLIEENCRRLGVTSVQTTMDLQAAGSALYDRILIDAPCSNSGVVRRRVDLRWRLNLGEMQRLTQQQRSLLDQALLRLRPGGTLVYSTCSLEPEENGELIRSLQADNPGLKLVTEQTLLPWINGTDGAYVAKLTRG